MQSFALLALVASPVTAHYTLPSINGAADWTAVRKANNWQDNGFVGDVNSDDIRCNQLEAGTDSISVAAGDTVTATFNNALYHQGPFQSYLARVPEGEDINTWDSTDAVWFKIYQSDLDTSTGSSAWTDDGKSSVDVTIPACIPAGNYLMRSEQIALHSAQSAGGAQFYLSCGQMAVTGGGSTEPAADELVAFPGAYSAEDPGLMLNIYYPVLTSYTNPGPTVFAC